jgi:hypothetical protein
VPFTFSHPAAVLPLPRWVPALPLTALVIGSMAPDAEYYLPFAPVPRRLTHSFVGVATADLALGLGILVTVQLVLAAPLAALLPRPWAAQVRGWGRAGVPRTARQAAFIVVALMLGALTHVSWDAFTHVNGQVVEHAPALRTRIGHYPVFQWLQLLSSLFGLAVVAVVLARRPWWGFPGLSPAERAEWRSRHWVLRLVPLVVALSAVAVAVERGQRAAGDTRGLRFLVITGAGEGLVVALGVWALAFWVARSWVRRAG